MSRARFDFSHLTVDERVELAEELWASVAEVQAALPLTAAQAEELDRRVEEYRQDRNPGTPWREVLKKIEESIS
jgi:putative addiction module component (TIGR02574 family)